MKRVFLVLLVLVCFLSFAAFAGEKDVACAHDHEHDSICAEQETEPTRALACSCGSALIPSYRHEYRIGRYVDCLAGYTGHKDQQWQRKRYVTYRCPSCGFNSGEQVLKDWTYYEYRCPVYGWSWPC